MFESEINWLREELNKHNYNYYVLNKPTVSDKEYDDMMRRLQDLEARIRSFSTRCRRRNAWEAT